MKALRACFGFADGPVDAHCTHAKLDTAAPTTSRRLRKEQGPQHLDVRQCGERALPFPGDAIRPEQYQREHQDSKGARSEMVAESTPMAVTVFTLQPFGTVVHQNAASRSAYGDLACEVLPNHLLGAGLRAGPDEVVEDGDAACSDWDYYRRASADDALSQVFDLEPQQLSAMLQELQRGAAGSRVWRGASWNAWKRAVGAPSTGFHLHMHGQRGYMSLPVVGYSPLAARTICLAMEMLQLRAHLRLLSSPHTQFPYTPRCACQAPNSEPL